MVLALPTGSVKQTSCPSKYCERPWSTPPDWGSSESTVRGGEEIDKKTKYVGETTSDRKMQPIGQ